MPDHFLTRAYIRALFALAFRGFVCENVAINGIENQCACTSAMYFLFIGVSQFYVLYYSCTYHTTNVI